MNTRNEKRQKDIYRESSSTDNSSVIKTVLLETKYKWIHAQCADTNTIFRRVLKTAKSDFSFDMSVLPSAAWNNSAPTKRILIKLEIWAFFFENMSRKLKFHYNASRTDTLQENVFIFMTISSWILLRIKNVSDKNCRENQNTHFMSNNVSPKIVPFIR